MTKSFLGNFIVPENHIMISFDDKSLFTSVPSDLALESISKILENNQIWQKKIQIKKI